MMRDKMSDYKYRQDICYAFKGILFTRTTTSPSILGTLLWLLPHGYPNSRRVNVQQRQ